MTVMTFDLEHLPPAPDVLELDGAASLLRLMSLPRRSTVLAMVGVGTLHQPMVPDALYTLKLWRDVRHLDLWVALFDRALRGVFCLDGPVGDSSDLPAFTPASAPFVSESVTDCLRGAMTRMKHACNRPITHVVAMTTSTTMVGVPLTLIRPDDPAFTNLPLERQAGDPHRPSTPPTVAREVLHRVCDQRLQQEVLIRAYQDVFMAPRQGDDFSTTLGRNVRRRL